MVVAMNHATDDKEVYKRNFIFEKKDHGHYSF